MKEPKIYKIKCKCLSPIHIGDGTELEPFEYVIKDKIYKINLNEFIYSLSIQIRNDLTGIRKFIRDYIDIKNFTEWQTGVSETVRNIYNEKFNQPKNQLLLKPFIRSNNRPYIPGSSIKGAIRTALLNQWSYRIKDEIKDKAQIIEGKILNAVEFNPKKKKFVPKMEKDPFRALKIRDVFLPPNSTMFIKVSNFNINKYNSLQETNIQIIVEVLKSHFFGNSEEFEPEILIDIKLFENPATTLQRGKFDINFLLSACNNFYSQILESERRRLFDSREKNIAAIYRNIKEEAKGGYLLRIGWASGFESMTLAKFRVPKNPRRGRGGWGFSKHLGEGKYPLGWLKLNL